MAHIDRQVNEIIAAMLEQQRAKTESASKPRRDRSVASKCAVCTKDAVSRCSKCRVVWFCGPECAKLLWPSHKALCGADPDYFHVAPLSNRECRDLETVLDGPIYQCGEEVFEQMPITLRQAMTLQYFQGFEDIDEDLSTWADVKRLLQSPAPTITTRAPYERDPRHTLIALARTQLDTLYMRQGGVTDPRHSEPWQLARNMVEEVIHAHDEFEEDLADLQVNRPFNHFLRQLLIFFTMLSHFVKAPKEDVNVYLGHMRTAREKSSRRRIARLS